MSIETGDGDDLAPGDINPRLWKALREPMDVVPTDPDVADAEWAVAVYNDGRRYAVNLDVGFCECPDFEHRRQGTDEECKHLLRARVAVGDLDVPAWANAEALDRTLQKRLGVGAFGDE